jgi:hypothetical protein
MLSSSNVDGLISATLFALGAIFGLVNVQAAQSPAVAR